jgi:hypothetical protein
MKDLSATMKFQLLKLTRVLELVAGIVVFLLGFCVWLSLILTTPAEPLSSELVFFFMVVAPGFLFGLGCYLQIIHHRRWVVALVLIGGVLNLRFVLGACFLLAYIGNRLGVGLFYADFGIVIVTLVATFIHALIDLVLSNLAVSGKSVDK